MESQTYRPRLTLFYQYGFPSLFLVALITHLYAPRALEDYIEHGILHWRFILFSAFFMISMPFVGVSIWFAWKRFHIELTERGIRYVNAHQFLFQWSEVLEVNDLQSSKPGWILQVKPDDKTVYLRTFQYVDRDVLLKRFFESVPATAKVDRSLSEFIEPHKGSTS